MLLFLSFDSLHNSCTACKLSSQPFQIQILTDDFFKDQFIKNEIRKKFVENAGLATALVALQLLGPSSPFRGQKAGVENFLVVGVGET